MPDYDTRPDGTAYVEFALRPEAKRKAKPKGKAKAKCVKKDGAAPRRKMTTRKNDGVSVLHGLYIRLRLICLWWSSFMVIKSRNIS